MLGNKCLYLRPELFNLQSQAKSSEVSQARLQHLCACVKHAHNIYYQVLLPATCWRTVLSKSKPVVQAQVGCGHLWTVGLLRDDQLTFFGGINEVLEEVEQKCFSQTSDACSLRDIRDNTPCMETFSL